ncbi:MAG: DUF3052 domain-containing protein [Ornithinimicrobium sp.]
MDGTDSGSAAGVAKKLGFKAEQIVIEFGYDDDVDEEFRVAVEEIVNSPLEDEDYDGVVDAVVLWWRDGEGDLTDELVDALTMVEEGGFIALITPGIRLPNRVEAFTIQEACLTSGLTASGAVPMHSHWHAQRLVGRK